MLLLLELIRNLKCQYIIITLDYRYLIIPINLSYFLASFLVLDYYLFNFNFSLQQMLFNPDFKFISVAISYFIAFWI